MTLIIDVALVVEVGESILKRNQSVDAVLSLGGLSSGGDEFDGGVFELLSECSNGVVSSGKLLLSGFSGCSWLLQQVSCSSSGAA